MLCGAVLCSHRKSLSVVLRCVVVCGVVLCHLWQLAVFVHVERSHIFERDLASLRHTGARIEST
jgi:hypothetical protein